MPDLRSLGYCARLYRQYKDVKLLLDTHAQTSEIVVLKRERERNCICQTNNGVRGQHHRKVNSCNHSQNLCFLPPCCFPPAMTLTEEEEQTNQKKKKKEINKPKSNLAKKKYTIIFSEREYRYYKLLKHKLTENRGKHGSTASLQVYTYSGCMRTTCEVQRLHTEEKWDLERITVGLREGLKVCISFLPPWDSLRGRYSISAVHRSAVTLSCPVLTGNF